jgi:16S rRNA (guanine966-N2)-methyltransferase
MRVLDLYAGTGALGAEAISRGAEAVVYVELAPRCLAALRANLRALGIEAVSRVIADDAPRAVRRLGRSGQRFDLLLLDPPYASGEIRRALKAVTESGVLAEGAMVVAEHGKRHALPAVAGLVVLDARRYGDTVITRLTAAQALEQDTGGPSGT